MKHYKFGGSTAARTDACAAWVKLSEGIPNIESDAARSGTRVHYMLEMKNTLERFSFAECAGQVCPETGDDYGADEVELAEAMWSADLQVQEKYRIAEWEAETTGEWDADTGSTVDKVFIGTMPDGRPMVGLIDYKSGRGFQVEAEGNKQLLHNAFCLMANSGAQDMFEDVEVLVGIIIQPSRDGEVQIREWEFTHDQVLAYRKEHLLAIDRAKRGGKALAGKHCAFCPAAATCPEKTGAARAAMLRDPANVEQLAENMDMVEDLKKWCAEVEKAVYNTLEVGQDVPGWKLVAKRATERWVDTQETIKKLGRRIGGKKNLMDDKLITPAEARRRLAAKGMEKSVADRLVSNLTDKKSSGSTLAPDDDKRKAVLSVEGLKAALAQVI